MHIKFNKFKNLQKIITERIQVIEVDYRLSMEFLFYFSLYPLLGPKGRNL